MVYEVGTEPIDESAPLRPASPYGLSKLAQDELARRAAAEDGLDVVVARPFNHIGPRQGPGFAVSSFARQIALIEAGRAEPVIEVGNLDARRDFSDVRDVVAAYEALMTHGRAGRAYNICSGQDTRLADVLDALVALARRGRRRQQPDAAPPE
jgi:GDP-4-dehydro-6-deoxy-D-mannose reductase